MNTQSPEPERTIWTWQNEYTKERNCIFETITKDG